MRRLLITLFLATAMPAAAEVTEVLDGGFTSHHEATVAVPAERAWEAMTGEIHRWWDGDHSWSADAGNLYLNAEPGGCFCENLPGGGWVEHLRIIYLDPPREIRLDGALGPLMDMGVRGVMTWAIETNESGGSTIRFTYKVHGHLKDGFSGIAPAVDGVVGQQLTRLVELLASG